MSLCESNAIWIVWAACENAVSHLHLKIGFGNSWPHLYSTLQSNFWNAMDHLLLLGDNGILKGIVTCLCWCASNNCPPDRNFESDAQIHTKRYRIVACQPLVGRVSVCVRRSSFLHSRLVPSYLSVVDCTFAQLGGLILFFYFIVLSTVLCGWSVVEIMVNKLDVYADVQFKQKNSHSTYINRMRLLFGGTFGTALNILGTMMNTIFLIFL